MICICTVDELGQLDLQGLQRIPSHIQTHRDWPSITHQGVQQPRAIVRSLTSALSGHVE